MTLSDATRCASTTTNELAPVSDGGACRQPAAKSIITINPAPCEEFLGMPFSLPLSPSLSLLISLRPQGNHRVDLRRPPGGQPRCNQHYESEQAGSVHKHGTPHVSTPA